MSILRYASGMGFVETVHDRDWPVQMVMATQSMRTDEETFTPRNDNVWTYQATLEKDFDDEDEEEEEEDDYEDAMDIDEEDDD